MTNKKIVDMEKQDISSFYNITGFFYQLNGNKEYNFRKYLNIVEKEAFLSNPALTTDLMVVMMNPGGSHPIHGFNENNYNKDVITKHDNTQIHIMNFMSYYGSKYARVLNLSDYCNPNSENFYKKIPNLDKDFKNHSIFYDSRVNDFKKLWVKNIPVVIAWGVNSKLTKLAKSAFDKITPQKIIGLKKKNSTYGYYHPMRHNYKDHDKSWFKEMKDLYKNKI